VAVLAPLWAELTSWLSAHAPQTFATLRPPGDPARLTVAEQQLGFALGAELTEWWHLHDGSMGRPFLPGITTPGYDLFGVDSMLETHRMQLEVNLEEEVNEMARGRLGLADDEAGGPARYFPSEFVPIGTDGGGNDLIVDCRPGPESGRLRDNDHEDSGVVQPSMFESLADLLAQMVRSLHTGDPLDLPGRSPVARVPTVEAGALSWWAP
jgi:cell wall assembly regulator SMI1